MSAVGRCDRRERAWIALTQTGLRSRGSRSGGSGPAKRSAKPTRGYCWLMAEMVPLPERVRAGEAALARGAWDQARAIFEQQLEAGETVEALEGLSWAAWWVEDAPACLEARERAYRLSRREGDRRRAAMLAVWLADDYLVLRGERAVANGWFQRAARLLEGFEPCPEHGWLDALLGYMAMVEGDQARAKELAVRARELGRRLGVVSLEMFALSVEGVALVNEGDVVDGMRCLDEATAAALAGEYEEIVPAGWTCCLLLNACERARLRARRGVVQQGRGVRAQDEDQLRHRRLPSALRCGADLAGPLGRGRAGAHRSHRIPGCRAAHLERPRDRAARGFAPSPRALRRGAGAASAEPRETRSSRW